MKSSLKLAMNKFVIAVHGGAGPDSAHIKQHKKAYEDGLRTAARAGYDVLEKGGTALDAVEAAVKSLEDNPFFNAGRGSALNAKGEIEMDASIMDGATLRAGAVSMLKNVRNPVGLARIILDRTNHVLLSDHGALELARDQQVPLEPESYFVTDHQLEEFLRERDHATLQEILRKRVHGTVGAVALDRHGTVAAATSTGGTTNALPGRIGDSCLIGAGCYANNGQCAVSGTGDGEFLITGVIANTIALYQELKGCSLQEACDHVIQERNKDRGGQMGVIAVDPTGAVGISFNSPRMHRAWMTSEGEEGVKIY